MCAAVIFVKMLMHGECVGANVKTQSDEGNEKVFSWRSKYVCAYV